MAATFPLNPLRRIITELASSNYQMAFPVCLPLFPAPIMAAPNWARDGEWIYFCSDHDPGDLSTMENAEERRVAHPGDDKRGCLWDRVAGWTVPLLRQTWRDRGMEKIIG